MSLGKSSAAVKDKEAGFWTHPQGDSDKESQVTVLDQPLPGSLRLHHSV